MERQSIVCTHLKWGFASVYIVQSLGWQASPVYMGGKTVKWISGCNEWQKCYTAGRQAQS